jgi:hypothetical protein
MYLQLEQQQNKVCVCLFVYYYVYCITEKKNACFFSLSSLFYHNNLFPMQIIIIFSLIYQREIFLQYINSVLNGSLSPSYINFVCLVPLYIL